jgi:hypothetical protein
MKRITKTVRLGDVHAMMLARLAAIYGTEAAAMRIAIEQTYWRAREMLGDEYLATLGAEREEQGDE